MGISHPLYTKRTHVPYYVKRVQSLHTDDHAIWADFVHWIIGTMNEIHDFLQTYYSALMQNSAEKKNFQLAQSTRILGNYLAGLNLLPERLTDTTKRIFFEQVQRVPLPTQRVMWLMHNGAPAHFPIKVRNFLNDKYSAQWIRSGGSVETFLLNRSQHAGLFLLGVREACGLR
ncbi:hypothetical protein TNCV_2616351 [Trichonephila clavipes]|nr:hypothetical protein TNCV_2616351 [Trichonephila clavipes]